MNPQPPEATEAQSSQHRERRWARYPATDETAMTVQAGKETFEAFAVDESIGGLGIETHGPVAVARGQVVNVLYRDEHSRGRITSISPNADGGCRISISWAENDERADEAVQAAYFEHGPVTVVCRSRVDSNDQQASITLWNGMQFKVTTDQLIHRSEKARLTELQTMGEKREVIALLYGLSATGSPQELAARILRFEFDQ